MSSSELWEHFCVVGLSQSLVTVLGEQGWLGSDHRYKPHLIDSLPQNVDSRIPPELPTCCLPGGVDIVLQADVGHRAALSPQMFGFILTEGDGTKMYASCLTFHDPLPSELCCKHEELLGAKALKAICLLSHQFYMQSADQVLKELYRLAFWNGTKAPLPEVISSLLTVPTPHADGPKVCLQLGQLQRTLCPPLAVGPPPGELSLMPLLEVLRPDNLVGLFAAVLLEQRVLLRSSRTWLLTVVAEGVVRLLYPLKYQHVYVPVMPFSLVDYLEAPTPFLMGLHSDAHVDPKLLDTLVVVDLDNDVLSLGKDDGLMQRCLDHAYMKQLRNRVRTLLRPSVTDVEVLEAPQDPWVTAARQLSRQQHSLVDKQAMLIRFFMEFFRDVLDNYQQFLREPANSFDLSSRASSLNRARSSMQEQMRRASSSAAQIAAEAASLAGSNPGLPAVSRPARLSNPGAEQYKAMDMQAVLQHHQGLCRHSDPTLLQQIMQGLPFLSFVDQQGTVDNPAAWLSSGREALRAWKAAEQQLLDASDVQQDSGIEFVSVPQQLYWPLMPAGGVRYSSFPALITTERDVAGGKLVRRDTGSRKRRQTGTGGKRRAVSELMGQHIDLWGNASALSLDVHLPLPPALNAVNVLPKASMSGAASLNLPAALPNHSHLMTSSVTLGSPRSSMLSMAYSAEAELVRRQTAVLVQLMQVSAAGQGSGDGMSQSDLEAARSLLCVQTGGNGWFLISKLREIISGRVSSTPGAAVATGPAPASLNLLVSVSDTGAPPSPKGTAELSYHMSRSEADLAVLGRSKHHKTSKLFSVNSGSSATGRTSPIQTKIIERVGSLADMASAFGASVLNRSASGTRSKSITSPKRQSVDGREAGRSEVSPSARSGGGPHSVSGYITESSSHSAAQVTLQQPNPAELTEASTRNSSNTTSTGSAAAPGSLAQRCVSAEVFGVLAEMFSAAIEVAAVHEDYRVVLAALELACVITCQSGPGSQLLYKLAHNPVLHTDWFWAGAFNFALSSSCLQSSQQVAAKAVVLQCLADFAHYMAGVGVPGYVAWMLLMLLASEYLANCGSSDPQHLLDVRAQLAAQEVAAQQHLHTAFQGAGAAGAVARQPDSSSNSISTSAVAGQPSRLPDDVADELLAMGLVPRPGTTAAQLGSNKAGSTAPAETSCTSAVGLKGAPGTGLNAEPLFGLQHSSDGQLPSTKRVSGQDSQHSTAAGSLLDRSAEFSLAGNLPPVRPAVDSGSSAPALLPPAAETSTAVLQEASSNSSAFAGMAGLALQEQGSSISSNLKAAALHCTTANSNNSSTLHAVPASARDAAGRLSRRGSSRFSPRATSSPRSPTSRARQYAEMYMLQHSQRSGAAGSAAAAASGSADASTAAAAADTAAADALQLEVHEEGGSLLQPGALHWAALHKKAVAAVDVCHHTVVTVGMDGLLKVTDTSQGHMRVKTSINIPALQLVDSSTDSSASLVHTPVLKLWPDGRRAAVGNANGDATWVIDLHQAAATTELPGLGSSVSVIHTLQRNRDALLTGLNSSGTSYSSNRPGAAASVYLWDIRRPMRPAASLDLPDRLGAALSAAVSSEVALTGSPADADRVPEVPVSSTGQQQAAGSGVLCLSVHEDGVLAAAGCRDGRALVWDMRKPSAVLATCLGHKGPVRHIQFAPAAVATAAGTAPLLLTASDDWTARLWDVGTGSCKAACVGHAAAVTAMQLVSDSAVTRLITGAADGSVGVWGLGGELHSISHQHAAPVQQLAVGNGTIVSGAQDNGSHVYSLPDVHTCSLYKPLQPVASLKHPAVVHSMAFDQQGQLLVSGHTDGSVSVWNCSQ